MQFEDIRPISIEDYLATHARQLPTSESVAPITSLEGQAVVKLIELNIPAKVARSCVKKVLGKQKTGQSLGKVVQKAFKLALSMDIDDVTDSTNDTEAATYEKDLRNIIGEDSYDNLKASNVISNDEDEW